ncbi:unnamed protein product [Ranitomeya imitator]|uniref:Secreted protein n=1 Tax=Ranitomeya imitator TaxID=111125 RepID=A0ABN9MBR6_9NEOB|nr:unnamed protein product [Ranitomeya imitator]
MSSSMASVWSRVCALPSRAAVLHRAVHTACCSATCLPLDVRKVSELNGSINAASGSSRKNPPDSAIGGRPSYPQWDRNHKQLKGPSPLHPPVIF